MLSDDLEDAVGVPTSYDDGTFDLHGMIELRSWLGAVLLSAVAGLSAPQVCHLS